VVVRRGIPNGQSGSVGRVPLAEVLEPQSADDGEPTIDLPLIVQVERVGVVLEVSGFRRLILVEPGRPRHQQVSYRVASAVGAPVLKVRPTLRAARLAAGGLVVTVVVAVEAGFDGVGALYPGDVVGDTRRLRQLTERILAARGPVRAV